MRAITFRFPNFLSTDSLSRLITPQIVVILVVAAVLRLHHITQPFTDAFSWRQASTAMMADNFYRTNRNIFYPEVNWSGPGPNYQGRELQTVSYIAALLYTVLGQPDWVGRSVAVLFGLWGVFALHQLIRRVWDEKYAIAGASVMAVLPGSIFIERSFLPDPAMVALVTTSFWLLVVYLQTERWRYLLLAGLIGAWGFCTKVPGLIVGLPMAYTWLTVLGRKRVLKPKMLVAPGVFAFLTLVPVIAYYLWARHLALSYPPFHFAAVGNWVWKDGLQAWWGQNYFLSRLSQRFTDWVWTLPVIGLVALGLLIPRLPERRSPASANDQERQGGTCQVPGLFHFWLLGGLLYYLVGAKELVENPWNFHIINPAAAALAGHAIIVVASCVTWAAKGLASVWRAGQELSGVPALATAAILLVIVVSGQRGLQWMYYPYAYESYKLGLALREITQPGDLVVTMANDLGDPVAIYYSQRRGWVFPPAQPNQAWNRLPEEDSEAIRLFEELRASGAGWLGIVNERKNDFWKYHRALVEHIKATCEFHSQTPEYVIYRVLSPEEVAKLTLSRDQIPVSAADTPLVTQKIRYHMPEAGEAFLVWGINGWQMVAGETRPAGTVVKDTVMHTPMDREGDTFVVRVQMPAGATINYGFLITGSRSGARIEAVWDSHQDDLIATEDDVIEIERTLTLARDQAPASVANAPLVTQEIRYHMPEAGEVFLGWGINGWNVVPEEIRLAGTEVRNEVMHTPMT
jgi:hypothetical protein